MRKFLYALASTAVSFAAGMAGAQTYPERPINLVVPFAAGGPSDAIGRLVGQSMSGTLGQQLIVESVGGAGGTLGAARVAHADPDGYTLLIAHVSLAAGASLYPNLTYDTATAFAPVGMINQGPMVLLARKDFDAKDAGDLIQKMRDGGEDISLGHAGVGSNSHLCAVLLQEAMGAKFTLAAYQGTGPAMNDLMAGTIDVMCDQSTTSIPQIQGGTVKGYAVTSAERMEALKDLPTMQETGLDGFDFTIWHGLYAPAGTPSEIVNALNAALQVALDDQKIRDRFAAVGTSTLPADQRSPEAHDAKLQLEIKTWQQLLGTNAQ
ncbi:tripartite tricarboxylate transporter substrate-binding protein [Paracoccus laeviglucosivorans]|uniref:Tripartite-type tricarboxylate transporter, receptor component TctC n=1 Tax=Paracoccus laeviglucosivorans TaxID=1197861 RepID=A0A521FPZ0_9RHOB|nr:tripartite tricarboxylate transporter substrate-binding protein [Paracoccus laeviglucosivorans]SMO97531.1 Tripartite-type tricarboxylate transporter, receptor component TctC [Paracoccus laeviglucosivorans]